jgi:hypothetical protein
MDVLALIDLTDEQKYVDKDIPVYRKCFSGIDSHLCSCLIEILKKEECALTFLF